MAQLALNSDSLSGFATTLRGLTGDYPHPVLPASGPPTDLNDALASFVWPEWPTAGVSNEPAAGAAS